MLMISVAVADANADNDVVAPAGTDAVSAADTIRIAILINFYSRYINDDRSK